MLPGWGPGYGRSSKERGFAINDPDRSSAGGRSRPDVDFAVIPVIKTGYETSEQ
jgi:hypothetical protein